MSHHLVTVCMFCLLCAARTCASHVEVKRDIAQYEPKLHDQLYTPIDFQGKKTMESTMRHEQRLDKLRHRSKREVGKELQLDNEKYLQEIFNMYGDGVHLTMNITQFNGILKALGLEDLIQGGVKDNRSRGMIPPADDDSPDTVKCLNSTDLISKVNRRLLPHSSDHEHSDHSDHSEPVVNKMTMKYICPILLYQKLGKSALERTGCVIEDYVEVQAPAKNMVQIWLYSSLSIVAISACGLLGVAVIPIMHKTYYNHLLQFLVALAVGTLCGDALLHLMPHAMSPIEENEHHHDGEAVVLKSSHDDGMWKGLAAMLGVVFFYFTEKGLTVVVEWRKRRQKLEDDKLPSRVRVLKDDNAGGCSGGSHKVPVQNSSNSLLKIFKKDEKNDPMTKMCKHKYSEYPYCYDEIDTDTHDDHHMRDGQIPPSPKANKNNHNNSVCVVSSNALNRDGKEVEPTAKDWLLKPENNMMVEMNNINHKEDGAKDLKDGDSYTVILREHSRAHHGHSHAHGHVHAPPSSLSSVAWMVIMGDGLHNFTDGMAIGAAFASGLAGGFSTAIAVLCHELPHELGDFAVLLKAGMSVKRAVCYNVLSSALCLAGMVCGVLAGHTPSATRWLFAVAAGTFLYIALVDMMPELSTSHSKEGTLCQCILQLMGLASGIGIMLLIALYEHDLKHLFSSN